MPAFDTFLQAVQEYIHRFLEFALHEQSIQESAEQTELNFMVSGNFNGGPLFYFTQRESYVSTLQWKACLCDSYRKHTTWIPFHNTFFKEVAIFIVATA